MEDTMFVNMGPVLQNFKSFPINVSPITENERISALMHIVRIIIFQMFFSFNKLFFTLDFLRNMIFYIRMQC